MFNLMFEVVLCMNSSDEVVLLLNEGIGIVFMGEIEFVCGMIEYVFGWMVKLVVVVY